jgi:hypothetical protein
MSDYSVTTDFSVKDGLTAGDPEKLILGSDFDVEFDAIAVAIATKYDSADLASQAQAEAETSNVVLMTPLRVANWADANAGIVGDLQALASPGADRILFWDDGAAGAAVLTPGNGIEISTTNLQLEATIAGNGLTYSAGVVNVVGGNGITANANDIALTDAAASTTNPVDISTGTVSLDVEALTTIEGSALAATDTFYVEDAGVSKGIEVQAMGDMNSIMEFTGTATLTLPLNSTTDLPVGVPIVLNVKHATQVLTVTAAASVALPSCSRQLRTYGYCPGTSQTNEPLLEHASIWWCRRSLCLTFYLKHY